MANKYEIAGWLLIPNDNNKNGGRTKTINIPKEKNISIFNKYNIRKIIQA